MRTEVEMDNFEDRLAEINDELAPGARQKEFVRVVTPLWWEIPLGVGLAYLIREGLSALGVI